MDLIAGRLWRCNISCSLIFNQGSGSTKTVTSLFDQERIDLTLLGMGTKRRGETCGILWDNPRHPSQGRPDMCRIRFPRTMICNRDSCSTLEGNSRPEAGFGLLPVVLQVLNKAWLFESPARAALSVGSRGAERNRPCTRLP